MIVRDGATSLARCLSSVTPVADELVVVDTGSHDDTGSIATSFGARLTAELWTDDFSAARNRYLEIAQGRWILSLDADEWLPGFNLDSVRATVNANSRTAFGVTVRNFFHHDLEWPRFLPPSEFGGRASDQLSWHVSRTVRLFPHLPGLSYRFPVHESLIPAARDLGVPVRMSDLVIHHGPRVARASGTGARSSSNSISPSKTALYRALGEDKVARYPAYHLGHLEMAKVYLESGSWDLAEAHLRQCLRLSPLTWAASYSLGEVLLHGARWRDLTRLLSAAPMKRIDRTYLEGRRLLGTGKAAQAEPLLAAVLAEKPDYRPARAALDLAGVKRGDVARHRRSPLRATSRRQTPHQ